MPDLKTSGEDTHLIRKTYDAFLASAWHTDELKSLRQRIHNDFSGAKLERVYVAEISDRTNSPEEKEDQLEIVDTCLEAIEQSNQFILLDVGEYGTYLGQESSKSVSSFLELELFQAVLHKKPIHFLLVGQQETELASLVSRLPNSGVSKTVVGNLDEAEAEISKVLDGKIALSAAPGLVSDFTDEVLRFRQKHWSDRKLFSEPELFGGLVVGNTVNDVFDAEIVDYYLQLAEAETHTSRVLTRTWIAIRYLMKVHYSTTHDPVVVGLWRRAFSLWLRATSWRGLHGHIRLGNVSALGSHALLLGQNDIPFFDENDPRSGDLFNDLCSAYYSVSKMAGRGYSRSLLKRSEAYLSAGLKSRSRAHTHKLLPLKGALEMRRLRLKSAVATFSEALALAEGRAEDQNEIGFLMTELGFVEALSGSPRTGRRRIVEGLSTIDRDTWNPGFLARAERKLAIASLMCFGFSDARDAAARALLVAEQHDMLNQIRAPMSWLARWPK